MTFDMVRYGWPNTIAILALAVMPLIAVTLPAEKAAAPSLIEQTQAHAPDHEHVAVSSIDQ